MSVAPRHPRFAKVAHVIGAIAFGLVNVIGAVAHGLDGTGAALPPQSTPTPKPGPPPEYRP
jgi:hypothetical protein